MYYTAPKARIIAGGLFDSTRVNPKGPITVCFTGERTSMENRFSTLYVTCLAIGITLTYMLASGYLSLLWGTLVPEPQEISHFSAWTIRPISKSPEFALWHWHLLALLSLALNFLWLRRNYLTNGCSPAQAVTLALVCHSCWLMCAFFLHVAGFIASFIMVMYVI
jgi:hypothetical protein